jgi:hypothetical protein
MFHEGDLLAEVGKYTPRYTFGRIGTNGPCTKLVRLANSLVGYNHRILAHPKSNSLAQVETACILYCTRCIHEN